MRLQSSISLEKNRALVGNKFRVIVDEVDRKTAIARLQSQAPEIDGVVIIEQKHGAMGIEQETRSKKHFINSSRLTPHASRSLRPGEFVNVKIVGAYDYDLKGEPAA